MAGKADGSLTVLQNSLASFIEMNRFAASVLLLTFLLSVPSLANPHSQRNQQRDLPPSEIARIAIRSVVVIEAHEVLGTAYGTGFFVREDLVATNYHVVKDSYEITVRLVGSDTNYASTVVGKDEENDLAILQVQGLRGYSLRLALTPIQVGQEIYVLSNPREYEGTFTRGMVNAYRGSDMQIDAPISHGSSGGPVLNKQAQVVAIARASETGGQNLNFAVPVSYLSRLISFTSPISASARSSRAVSRISPMEAKMQSVYRDYGLSGLLDWYERHADYMDDELRQDAQRVLRRARIKLARHPENVKGTPAEKQAIRDRLDGDLKPVQTSSARDDVRKRKALSRMSPMEAKIEGVYRDQGLEGLLDWCEKYVDFMDPEDVKDAQRVLRRARTNIIKHPEVLKGTPAQKQALMERLDRDLKAIPRLPR